MSMANVVGFVQSVVLAVAAWFAWRTYRASQIEHRRAPRRRLLEDAFAELKALAYTIEVNSNESEISAAQRRLAISLASIRWMQLLSASEVAYATPRTIDWGRLQDATADLTYALRWLELDPHGLGEDPPGGNDDRAPLPSPPRNARERCHRSRLLRRLKEVYRLIADSITRRDR